MGDAREAGVCGESPPALVERGPDGMRTAWLLGGGGRDREAWRVLEEIEGFATVAEAAAATGLTPHQVRVVLEYAERFPGELEAQRAHRGD